VRFLRPVAERAWLPILQWACSKMLASPTSKQGCSSRMILLPSEWRLRRPRMSGDAATTSAAGVAVTVVAACACAAACAGLPRSLRRTVRRARGDGARVHTSRAPAAVTADASRHRSLHRRAGLTSALAWLPRSAATAVAAAAGR
jgi:hypothetical protein